MKKFLNVTLQLFFFAIALLFFAAAFKQETGSPEWIVTVTICGAAMVGGFRARAKGKE